VIQRALLALALLLLGASPAFAACTGQCVQHQEAFTAGSSTPTAVFTNNVGATNTVVMYIVVLVNGSTVNSVSTDFGATCVLKNANTAYPTNAAKGTFAYCYNATGSAKTITVTLSGSDNTTIFTHEVSGILTTDPYDGSAINNQVNPGTGTDAITSGAIITTGASDYLFGMSRDEGNTTTYTAGTGYTIVYNANSQANEFQIQGSGGSVAATFTGTGAATNYQTGILALKPTAGAATTSPGIIGGGFNGPGKIN
jgi:hypothetical protein